MLTKLEDGGATFDHKPLFGDKESILASLDSLKRWKLTKRECPSLCPSSLTIQRLPQNYDLVLKEADKIQANALLKEAYMNNVLKDTDMLGFTAHPSGLVTLKKVKKSQLKLFPLGTCTPVQDKEYEKVVEKGKSVVVWFKGVAYQVQPYKSLAKFDPEENGALCPYFWVKAIEGDDQTNMSTTWVDFNGLQIPTLQNEEIVGPQMFLLKAKEAVPSLPPAKKAKTSSK